MEGKRTVAKSWIGFLGIAAVVLGLAACGGGASSQDAQEPAATTEASAQGSDTSAGDTSTESQSAATGEEFVVGGTFALTGPAAAYGEIMSQGLLLGIDNVNAEGGAGGYTLRPEIIDMQGDAKLAALAAQRLISENDAQFISTHLTAPPLAQAPIVDREQVLLLNGAGNSPELAQASDYLLSNVFLVDKEQEILARWAQENLNVERVGILRGASYSEGALQTAIDAFESLGIEVVGVESHPFGAKDQKPQLQKLLQQDPDTLYLLNDATDTLLSLKQAYELGYRGNFLSSYVIIPDIPQLPAEQTANLYTPAPTYEPDPEFVSAYEEKYGSEPSIFVAQFYDQVLILRDVLNALAEEGAEVSGESIREKLIELKTFDTVSGQTTFGEDGTALKPMDVYQIKNGEWTIVDSVPLEEIEATLSE